MMWGLHQTKAPKLNKRTDTFRGYDMKFDTHLIERRLMDDRTLKSVLCLRWPGIVCGESQFYVCIIVYNYIYICIFDIHQQDHVVSHTSLNCFIIMLRVRVRSTCPTSWCFQHRPTAAYFRTTLLDTTIP